MWRHDCSLQQKPGVVVTTYGIVVGHLLRSIDPRDDGRTVEIVHVSDDGERYKVVNVATHRLTTLSRASIERSWEIVGMPGERDVEAERDHYRRALERIAAQGTHGENWVHWRTIAKEALTASAPERKP
jgi:hypothetical protein